MRKSKIYDLDPMKLRAMRRSRFLSQDGLGNRIGTDQKVVSLWETGKTGISPKYKDRLLKEFGCAEEELGIRLRPREG